MKKDPFNFSIDRFLSNIISLFWILYPIYLSKIRANRISLVMSRKRWKSFRRRIEKKEREREKKYLESFHRFDLQILKYYLPKKQGEGIRRRIWKNFHLDRVQNPSSSVDQTKGNSSGRKSRAGAAHFHPVEDVLLKIFVVERFHGSIKWLSLSLFLLEENPRGDTRLTVHVEVEAHGHIHFSSAFLPPDNRPLPLSLSLSQGRAIVAPALGLKRVTHRYTSRRCW